MSFDVNNKSALITGANRGIGLAIVESFIAHGIKKIYAGVRTLDKADKVIQTHGAKIVPVTIDYDKPETIYKAAHTANDVEIVVSNAGVLIGAEVMARDVLQLFEKELQINVYGLIHMAHAFAPVLKANRGGAFVQLNSIASLSSFPRATYSASKAAAYSFTQALRDVLREQGTRVLSVHPGPILTDMAIESGFDEDADPASVVSEGIINSLKSGDFHLFPDRMAKDYEKAYRKFAEDIIESSI